MYFVRIHQHTKIEDKKEVSTKKYTFFNIRLLISEWKGWKLHYIVKVYVSLLYVFGRYVLQNIEQSYNLQRFLAYHYLKPYFGILLHTIWFWYIALYQPRGIFKPHQNFIFRGAEAFIKKYFVIMYVARYVIITVFTLVAVSVRGLRISFRLLYLSPCINWVNFCTLVTFLLPCPKQINFCNALQAALNQVSWVLPLLLLSLVLASSSS